MSSTLNSPSTAAMLGAILYGPCGHHMIAEASTADDPPVYGCDAMRCGRHRIAVTAVDHRVTALLANRLNVFSNFGTDDLRERAVLVTLRLDKVELGVRLRGLRMTGPGIRLVARLHPQLPRHVTDSAVA